MAGQKNLRHRIEERRIAAEERQVDRDARGDAKQLEILERDFNAEGKEATRLRKKIAGEEKK